MWLIGGMLLLVLLGAIRLSEYEIDEFLQRANTELKLNLPPETPVSVAYLAVCKKIKMKCDDRTPLREVHEAYERWKMGRIKK